MYKYGKEYKNMYKKSDRMFGQSVLYKYYVPLSTMPLVRRQTDVPV